MLGSTGSRFLQIWLGHDGFHRRHRATHKKKKMLQKTGHCIVKSKAPSSFVISPGAASLEPTSDKSYPCSISMISRESPQPSEPCTLARPAGDQHASLEEIHDVHVAGAAGRFR